MAISAKKRFTLTLLAPVAALSLLAGCASGDAGETTTETSSGSGGSSEVSLAGTTVTIQGAFVDTDAENFAASVAEFEQSTGITIDYQGSGDFVTLIATQAAAGNAPDIAFFPNPGLIGEFVDLGYLSPLPQEVVDVAGDNYIQSWLDLGTFGGDLYGLAYKASVKSLVWYPPKAFAEAGYEVPATWDELMALSEQIIADGKTPWCVGFGSGEATGWPGTDWIEDIILRQQGADYYDQWVNNEVPFTDAGVKQAFETLGGVLLDNTMVFGGSRGVLATEFGDAQAPMFADGGPQCYFHRQASWFTGFLPEGVTVAPDGDTFAFVLPPIDSSIGTPVMGGGDFAVAFADRPEVVEVMKFLATPASGETWAKAGGFVSPHKTFDTALYPAGIDQAAGEAAATADVFRFDGSDAMPGAVQPLFWAAMVDFVNGGNLDQILQKVQDAF
jgi:alpha-glucoside transport system substrate-binding protein